MYPFLLMLMIVASSALAFPLPEYVLSIAVKCTYVLMYDIYRGLRQRNLDEEFSKRESLEYLLDRDTFDSDDLEARAPLWPPANVKQKKPNVAKPDLNYDHKHNPPPQFPPIFSQATSTDPPNAHDVHRTGPSVDMHRLD